MLADQGAYLPTQEKIAAATAKIRAKRLTKKKASNCRDLSRRPSRAFREYTMRSNRRHIYLEPV